MPSTQAEVAATALGGETACAPPSSGASTPQTFCNRSLASLRAYASQLMSCEPIAVALTMLVVFLIGMVCTTKHRMGVLQHGYGCLPSEMGALTSLSPSTLLLYATAAGVALGSAIAVVALTVVLRLVRRERTVLRLATLHVAAIVLVQMYVYLQLVSLDAVAKACTTPLGGLASVASRQAIAPARYVYLCTGSASIFSMLGKLAGASPARIRAAILAIVIMTVFGLVAAVVDSPFSGWLCALIVVVLAELCVLTALYQFLRAAYTRCCDTRGLLQTLGPLSWLLWAALIIVYTAARCGAGVGDVVWPLLMLLTSACPLLEMTVGDFNVAAAETDTVLQGVDDARHAAETANAAKREVMRYLFHEIRTPLNSIVLASEDLLSKMPPRASSAEARSAGTPSLVSESRYSRLEEDAHDSREMLELIVSSSAGMTRLLNDFLSLEKAESGKMELELEPSHVLDLLQQTQPAFAAALQNRSLSVTLIADPSVPALVVLDPHRLRQCVANFLSNAIKFSPVGSAISLKAEVVAADGPSVTQGGAPTVIAPPSIGVAPSGIMPVVTAALQRLVIFPVKRSAAISAVPSSSVLSHSGTAGGSLPLGARPGALGLDHVRIHVGLPVDTAPTAASASSRLPKPVAAPPASTPSPRLRISVTNSGDGISREDQNKLFSPFAQIRPGAQQQAGGTGLGLAICRRIVELHGGRVGVRSAAGLTTFFLDIPLDLVAQPPTSVLLPQLHTHDALPAAAPVLHGAPSGTALRVLTSRASVSSAIPRSEARVSPLGHGLSGKQGGSTISPRSSGLLLPRPCIDCCRSNEGEAAAPQVLQHDCPSPLQVLVDVREPAQAQALLPGSRSPLARPATTAHGLSPSQSPVAAVELPQLCCAMVVDDISSNRLLLAKLLQRRGVANVIAVDGGHAALAAWRGMDATARAALQCVFCDKEMPGDLDGHDTVAGLRAEGFTGAILGVTGNALDCDRAAFVAAGADGVLAKPLSNASLVQGLHAVGLALHV